MVANRAPAWLAGSAMQLRTFDQHAPPMKLTASDLARLSSLLDAGLDLPVSERPAWIDGLAADLAHLRSPLRELLARDASHETGELIDRLPAFTVADDTPSGADFRAGDTIGPYRLLRELGRGGMGEVWLAERTDGHLKRPVALKLPMLALRRSVLVQRFARERDILGSLTHPHIARLYDAGLADDGQPYLALEYAEGKPITTYCDDAALDTRARIAMLRQVIDAVQYAHANLVVHRDLKPSNVLVTASGEAQLLDFGIAKLLQDEDLAASATELTQLGGRALTPDYAAPEQLTGAAVSTATDVYALGLLLYELLAGRRPFAANTRAALEHAVLNTQPARPSQQPAGVLARLPRGLASDLDTIVLKALKKAPGERYATANALAEDLDRFTRGEPVLAQPDSAWYRARKFIVRHAIAAGIAGATAVVVLGTGAMALWQATLAREQSVLARTQNERATQEARRAKAVQDFLIDIFRTNSHQQEDPLQAQKTTARELLDIGAARLKVALKDSPEAQIEVIGPLSDMYIQLGLRSQARDLLQYRLELVRKATHLSPGARAEATLAYAERLQDGEQRHLVPALLDEAQAILDAADDTTSFSRAVLLMQAARFHRYGSLSAARNAADRALAFMLQHHPARASVVTLHLLAGRARLNAGELAAAEASFRAGADAARRLGPRASAWLVNPLTSLAEAQQAQARFADAERSFRQALQHTLKVNGEEHGETLLTRIKLGNLLLLTGRAAEGAAELQRAERIVGATAARRDAQWHLNANVLRSASALERGRPDLAHAALSADVQALREHFGGSAVLALRQRQLADVLIALGQHEQAAAVLDDAWRTWQQVGAAQAAPSATNPFVLARARLLIAQRRPAEALEQLDAMALASSDAPTQLDAIRRDIERARALHALERAREAVEAAHRATLALESVGLVLPHLAAQAQLQAGLAARQVGDVAAARDALRRAVALRRQHDADGSVWLAEAQHALQAVLGANGALARR